MNYFKKRKRYLIVSRNKDNSEFYIRLVSNFIRGKKSRPKCILIIEKRKSEEQIISMMNRGYSFFVDNPTNGTLSDVIEVNGDIKTKTNKTKLDNISTLPLFL